MARSDYVEDFSVSCYWVLENVSMEVKGPDETVHAQVDVILHIMRMIEGTFSLDDLHSN